MLPLLPVILKKSRFVFSARSHFMSRQAPVGSELAGCLFGNAYPVSPHDPSLSTTITTLLTRMLTVKEVKIHFALGLTPPSRSTSCCCKKRWRLYPTQHTASEIYFLLL
jgi:hypothetical protein